MFPYSPTGANGHVPLVDLWLNPVVVEEAFRYVAGEKLYYERIPGSKSVPRPPFTALDIKVGDWEPSVEGYRNSASPIYPTFLYTCRWVFCQPGKADKLLE
jgi:hypothetical protein